MKSSKGFKLIVKDRNLKENDSLNKISKLTIGELLQSADKVTIDSNKGKITAVQTKEESIISISIQKFDEGEIITTSNFDNLNSKKDYEKTVKELLQQGKTQQEIAMMLGISQGYVSKLANR